MENIVKLEKNLIKKSFFERNPKAHKGSFGTLSIIGGCNEYRGAPVLSALGALAAGCGIVRLCSVESVCAAAAALLPNIIFKPLPQNDGFVHENAHTAALAPKASAVLLGVGLGNPARLAPFVRTVIQNSVVPVIIDADALNLLSGHFAEGFSEEGRRQGLAVIKNSAVPLILTPHLGEMSRLCAKTVEEIAQTQEKTAQEFCKEYNCTLILKNYKTVICKSGQPCLLYDDGGNAALAKGGSGDVLAGLSAGLLAQGKTSYDAAAVAVWLHAEAAKLAAAKKGTASALPQDVAACIADVLKAF